MDRRPLVTDILNSIYNTPVGTTGNHLDRDASNPLVPSLNFSTAFNYPNEDLVREYHNNKLDNHRYLRDSSPLVLQTENILAKCVDLNKCLLFSSGMKAVWSTIWAMINTDTIIVTFGSFYRKVLVNIESLVEKFSLRHINLNSLEELVKLKSEKAQNLLFYVESPANPFLQIYDVKKIRDEFKNSKIIYDNTLAGLCNDKVNHIVADVTITSLTKYIGGHNDLLGGAVFTNDEALQQKIWDVRSSQGGILDQMAAYLLFRSLKTYDVRIEAIQKNSILVTDFLTKKSSVSTVYYPGEHANSLDANDFNHCYYIGMGMISFELLPDYSERLDSAMSNLHSIKLAPSFGSTDSLIERPSIMSHFGKSEDELRKLGISNSFIRFSVGMEPIDYILADLERLVG